MALEFDGERNSHDALDKDKDGWVTGCRPGLSRVQDMYKNLYGRRVLFHGCC